MLRKSLMLTAVLCFLAVPLAADETNINRSDNKTPIQIRSGICLNTNNGSQEVIKWATSESQCRNSTNGNMWIENGVVKRTFQHGN